MVDLIANTSAFAIDTLNILGFLMILWLCIVLAWRAI